VGFYRAATGDGFSGTIEKSHFPSPVAKKLIYEILK
jgi:hypothetical protein